MARPRSIAAMMLLVFLGILRGLFAQERGPATHEATTAATTRPASTRPAMVPRAVVVNEMIVVPEQSTVGFTTVSPSTGQIDLSWPALPGTDTYIVTRSDKPEMVVGLYVKDVHALSDTNSHCDNQVDANTSYYYAIVASLGGDRAILVASGRAKTLAVDGPLMPNTP